ncbi:hypothetical protein [Olivibacter jilunii]|uniref:hypothetical protein n=1 Tax=Olivibacter jilunii TaxID=985016 RepID=UPI001031BCCD|nr:hypothetical protein [Olivibacter jilunii]
MKLILLVILTWIFPAILLGQEIPDNEIHFSLKSEKLEASSSLNPELPIMLVLKEADSLKQGTALQLDIEYPGRTIPPYAFNWKHQPIEIDQFVAIVPKTGKLTVTLSQTVGISKKLLNRFTIDPAGKVSHDEIGEMPEPVYYDPKTVKLESFNPKQLPQGQVVVYRPGLNQYRVFSDGNTVNGLRFPAFAEKNDPKRGVVLLIDNFNILKYSIKAEHSFNNRFTEVPALFGTVTSLISGSPTTASKATKNIESEIYKIAQLNSDLKRLLDEDEIDFEKARKQVLRNVNLNFGAQNGIIDITSGYRAAKEAVIEEQKSKSKDPYTSDNFNREFQQTLHIPLTPDSLVDETVKLYETFMAAKFRFASKIIQLENADEVVFNLDIKGKDKVLNAFQVPAQSFAVPIHGGIKVDFSTGFYYSNIKNEKYALRDFQVNDTTSMKELVPDGGSGGTVGISALAHIYPRNLIPYVSPSLTFGVGKSLDVNYSLLLGGSIIIGKAQRLVLSGGWNFTNRKVLSAANYTNEGNFKPLPTSETEVKYRSDFKTGWFAGISYNLGLGSKKQEASASTEEETTEKEEEKK